MFQNGDAAGILAGLLKGRKSAASHGAQHAAGQLKSRELGEDIKTGSGKETSEERDKVF